MARSGADTRGCIVTAVPDAANNPDTRHKAENENVPVVLKTVGVGGSCGPSLGPSAGPELSRKSKQSAQAESPARRVANSGGSSSAKVKIPTDGVLPGTAQLGDAFLYPGGLIVVARGI
jgi:hypothetical protein